MKHKKPDKTLKQLLQERGIKQVQVALDLNIPYSRLNLIVNGWQDITPELRQRFLDYFGCEAEDLGR